MDATTAHRTRSNRPAPPQPAPSTSPTVWSPHVSPERRAAISRAGQALVQLAIDPAATTGARHQYAIVNAAGVYTDHEADEAADVLERMVTSYGLTPATPRAAADGRADQVSTR